MSHAITALVLPDAHVPEVAAQWDLRAVPLNGNLTLFHVTHCYAAYWQAVQGVTGHFEVVPDRPPQLLFPTENVLLQTARELSGRPNPTFAILITEFYGGMGSQGAVVCINGGPIRATTDINDALRELGISAADGLDEFDTVGLGNHRSTPDYLDHYDDLCDELGV
ncbi:hypothetical protein [Nocardia camponoti]|uniref:Uncharacterized protein n=1 Tax=Nocardia camponoti TaxID=1616106 RepID=A0A917V3U5_9NOCA|nr:hypothetical protein [Nocardia camponoti]GGK32680.1 hypothetical protein GCM10011591_00490 [Nocardia camponoti]